MRLIHVNFQITFEPRMAAREDAIVRLCFQNFRTLQHHPRRLQLRNRFVNFPIRCTRCQPGSQICILNLSGAAQIGVTNTDLALSALRRFGAI